MQAHDSILAARAKQTRGANNRRRLSPFSKDDLCYVSTKNITFPKGYARKLVPKYIGPYKILDDYGNQSYKIDLPSHLKKRGVHNVFHASLLRIHVPNDDRLFPGRLDTQLGNQDTPDKEWAVDRIETHVGTRENAIFKMIWKSGDTTWMPYYQIEHLGALDAYFELLGIENVSNLPKREGDSADVPQDPQIMLGIVSYRQELNTPPFSPTFLPTSKSFHRNPRLSTTTRDIIMPTPVPLTHLYFTRQADGEHILTNPNNRNHRIKFTPQQLRAFIDHDAMLRGGSVTAAEPAGYDAFATLFNDPAGCCDIRFAIVDKTSLECVSGGITPTHTMFKVNNNDLKRSARMSTGGKPPKPARTVAAPTGILHHNDGSITYSSHQQALVERANHHVLTQFFRQQDAIEARRARRPSPLANKHACAPCEKAPRHAHAPCKKPIREARVVSGAVSQQSYEATTASSSTPNQPTYERSITPRYITPPPAEYPESGESKQMQVDDEDAEGEVYEEEQIVTEEHVSVTDAST